MYDELINRCYHTAWLEWFRNSKYAIPVLQSFHLMGLTAVLGVIVILALRLLGFGFLKLALAKLYRELAPWFLGALILTISAGVVIALIDPTRYLANTPFRLKMSFLAVAILYHYLVTRTVAGSAPDDEVMTTNAKRRLVGAFSLLIWFSVGWGGRLIAFFN